MKKIKTNLFLDHFCCELLFSDQEIFMVDDLLSQLWKFGETNRELGSQECCLSLKALKKLWFSKVSFCSLLRLFQCFSQFVDICDHFKVIRIFLTAKRS